MQSLALLCCLPTAVAAAPLRVLHLGDSFSSGNGARASNGSVDYHGVSRCYRSPSAWGPLLARQLNASYRTRACSFGKLGHLLGNRSMESTERPAQGCSSPEFPEEELVLEVNNSCQRLLRPQLDGVVGNEDLVLLTIAGNDMRFAGLLVQCVAKRNAETCRGALAFGKGLLSWVRTELAAVLAELRAKLQPHAKVLLVSYPHVLVNGTAIELEEGFYPQLEVRAIYEELDGAQAGAVELANEKAGAAFAVFYRDTKELFQGREAELLVSAPCPTYECLHLNQKGHSSLAAALAAFWTAGAPATEDAQVSPCRAVAPLRRLLLPLLTAPLLPRP